MSRRLFIPAFVLLMALIRPGAVVVSAPALAAELTAAGRAWIETCVAQRKASKEQPAKLRAYCACMQEIVDDNEPFDGITALERTYPPAHRTCWKYARRK